MRHGEAMHYANQEMYIKVHHNRSIYRTFGLSLMQYSDNRIMLYSVNAIIPLHKHGERLLVSTAFVTNPGGCLKERLFVFCLQLNSDCNENPSMASFLFYPLPSIFSSFSREHRGAMFIKKRMYILTKERKEYTEIS